MQKIIMKISVVALTLLLVACGNDVRVSVELSNTRDVKEGALVYLDEQKIGEVVDVEQQEGQTQLTIELDNHGVEAVKQNAALVINRLKPEAPLEVYNRQGSNLAIQDGQQLQGLDSMFQLGAWMVGDSLSVGANTLSGYVSAFQQYLDGDQWQQDKQVLENQAKQTAAAAQSMVEQVTTEVAKVNEGLAQAENDAAEAVEKLSNELAPVVAELAKSGESIVHELEKLTQNLNQQTEQQQAVGTDFMKSLATALEKLNESIEQSVEQDDPVPDSGSNGRTDNEAAESDGLAPTDNDKATLQLEAQQNSMPGAVQEPQVEGAVDKK